MEAKQTTFLLPLAATTMTASTTTPKATTPRTRKPKTIASTLNSIQATVDTITEQAQEQLDQLTKQQYDQVINLEVPAEVTDKIITLYPTRVGRAGDVTFTEGEASMLAKALESELGGQYIDQTTRYASELCKLAPYVRKTWALPSNLTDVEAALISNVLRPTSHVGGSLLNELPSKDWIKTVRTMSGLMAKLRLYGVEGLAISF